ncbi:hypothetical protein DFH08DRAFT_822208 [Mycena albidolilacea]|uniref:Uncharacterized protein n=1 Tax=Mycena albidolilacea TaxID=1033008 RepID=A0AAD6Z9H5_9AGAR|nr:hypothetical protein DFH08DRAFT_822208 [Mycena albidolilacea]
MISMVRNHPEGFALLSIRIKIDQHIWRLSWSTGKLRHRAAGVAKVQYHQYLEFTVVVTWRQSSIVNTEDLGLASTGSPCTRPLVYILYMRATSPQTSYHFCARRLSRYCLALAHFSLTLTARAGTQLPPVQMPVSVSIPLWGNRETVTSQLSEMVPDPRRLRVVHEGGKAFYALIGPVLAVIPASGGDPRVYFMFNSGDVQILGLNIDRREADCRPDSLSGRRRGMGGIFP